MFNKSSSYKLIIIKLQPFKDSLCSKTSQNKTKRHSQYQGEKIIADKKNVEYTNISPQNTKQCTTRISF